MTHLSLAGFAHGTKGNTDKNVSKTEGLHVCFVSSFPPNYARLSEYASFLINELRKHPGIKHIDVIADRAASSEKVKIDDKLTVRHVWRADDILSIISVFWIVLKLKPDVVHFNVAMAVFGRSRLSNFVGLLLPFLCSLTGFRTVVTLHNVIERVDVERMGFKMSLLNRIGSYIVLKLMTSHSTVTVLVRSYVELLRKKYGAKNVFFVPHGTLKVNPTDHGFPSNPKVVLYMGHTGPSKDLDLLLRSFGVLNQKRDNVRLVIAGRSHPNYPRFLEKYKDIKLPNVQFVGYVPNDRLHLLFHRTHVLVLPYHTCTGTSGMAHLAASFGVPIVATDLPEFKELVKEGCGIILCSHTVDSMVEKVQYVLDHPEVSSSLRRRSLEFAGTRTWDKIAKEFFKHYKSDFS